MLAKQGDSSFPRAKQQIQSRSLPKLPIENYASVLVLGAGAAPVSLCAIEAGKRGLRVALIEHAERIGKKILISGGGLPTLPTLHVAVQGKFPARPIPISANRRSRVTRRRTL